VNREADRGPGKGLKPWKTPRLRKVELTEDEVARLRAAEDPMALVVEMRPELNRGN
jgi:hypothetical protein